MVISEQVELVFATSELKGLVWLRPNRLGYSVISELRMDMFSLFPYPLVPMQLPPSNFPSNIHLRFVSSEPFRIDLESFCSDFSQAFSPMESFISI
jgi:hypothetical protein